MNARAKVTASALILIMGAVSFVVSAPLENYRVESVQPNGLPMITYPLYLVGFYLALLGIGMMVFGVIFLLSPVSSIGFRRAAVSSALLGAAVPLLLFSVFGILLNYSDWGLHSCGSPLADPVCGSISWGIVESIGIGGGGAASMVTGACLRFRRIESATGLT